MVMKVGQDVGSYRLVAEISHGDYAIIYQAVHHILTNRSVALKLLYTAPLHAQDAQEDFFREARILADLQHPHILPLIDVNLYEGLPYIITEFATQGSLRNRLNQRSATPMSVDEALSILTQIGEALDFAHQHNVVHCDVKPENILFNARSEAVLADFDIARTLSKATSATRSLGGTSAYMAPEQFQGKVRKESDQYALACIAYELFTGKRPFSGKDTATLMHAHLYERPPAPSQVSASLPSQVDEAILKALAKKYTDRYIDISHFLAALHMALASGEAHSRSPLVLKNRVAGSQKDATIYSEKTELNPPEIEKVPASRKRRVTQTTTGVKTTAPQHIQTTPEKTATANKVVRKKKPDLTEEKQPIKKAATSAKVKRAATETVEAEVPVKKVISKKRTPVATRKTAEEEKQTETATRKASVAKKPADTHEKAPITKKRASSGANAETIDNEHPPRKTKKSH